MALTVCQQFWPLSSFKSAPEAGPSTFSDCQSAYRSKGLHPALVTESNTGPFQTPTAMNRTNTRYPLTESSLRQHDNFSTRRVVFHRAMRFDDFVERECLADPQR